jgi:hypothetical protein
MSLPSWLPETFEEESKTCHGLAEYYREKSKSKPEFGQRLFIHAAENEDEKSAFLLAASKSSDEEVWKKACRVLTDGISALRPINTGPVNRGIPLRPE